MSYEHLSEQVMQAFRAENVGGRRLAVVGNKTENDEGSDNLEPSIPGQQSAAGQPLHRNPAFLDLAEAIRIIALGADALKGIGAMMQPESKAGDEQLNMARRGEASAIFEFFGEVLKGPAQIASEATDRLESLSRKQGC